MIKKTFDQRTETFYIVFKQGKHAIARFLKPNFSHIYILKKDKYNWMLIDPVRSRLAVDILAIPTEQDAVRALMGKLDHALKIDFYHRDTASQFGYVGLLNCVTWAKYILGINVLSLTPWRLYKRLVNMCDHDKIKFGIKSVQRI